MENPVNTPFAKFRLKYRKFRDVCKILTESTFFNAFIIVTIFINALVLALETYDHIKNSSGNAFESLDNIFFSIYTIEFFLKLVAEPKKYWINLYNLFDFVILMCAFAQKIVQWASGIDDARLGSLKVLRALRTFRTLKTISYVKGLQILVIALIDTVKRWVVNIIMLLLLIMFLFAIMGYYFFGYTDDGDKENWGSLGRAMMSLFTLFTADGWTELQAKLDAKGYTNSSIFTILFIILGNFIFTNVFVAVVIMNISQTTDNFKKKEQKEKQEYIKRKKEMMMQRQHNDVQLMSERQKQGNFASFKDMVWEFQKGLEHDESVMMSDICTNIMWMETFMRTLDHMDSTTYKIQQLHFELANHLASVLEKKMIKKYKKDA